MIIEFRTPESPGSSGNPGSLRPFGEAGLILAISINGGNDRFNLDDVGFFDLFYEGKSVDTAFAIEYIGKSTFFRDIYVFVDRMKDVARAKSDILLRQNLQICLRKIALA